ncbi:MAG: alpha/beta hydrolase-fold protein [Chitinophagaceae bacterium]
MIRSGFIVLLFASIRLQAQLPDLPILKDSLYSEVLKEMRPIEIVLPANYATSPNTKFDAFYVTDGEWNTRIVSDIRQFLNIQFIPENILISLPNVYPNGMNQRGRDFTPTHAQGMDESGGAEKFLSFIKTELIPYINKKYRTNGLNTLYGSSLGGIFAMYTLCKEPQLFQSYLMADPAWWWDNNYISGLVKENLDKLVPMDKTVLITGREGAPYQYMGIAKVDSILAPAKAKGIHWKTMLYNDETHNAMIFRTVYDGLKYTYSGYMKEEMGFHPMNGIVLQDKPVTIRVNNREMFPRLRYTTDGSAPTNTSPLVTADTIAITNPSKLIIKSASNRELYSKVATGNFKIVPTPLPVSPKFKNAQAGGFSYSYYEGAWDSLPDFKKLTPAKTGVANKDFDMKNFPRKTDYANVLQGQLEIKTDGYYLFGIDVEGGARFYFGNQLLIDYNGLHHSGSFQTTVAPLQKGFYPVRVEYFHKEGNAALNILYITPDNNEPRPIPLELQYASVKK